MLLASACVAGCAARTSDAPVATAAPDRAGGRFEVSAADARFTIVHAPGDGGAARQVAEALPAAARRASRWGPFRSPITIVVHPTRSALAAALGDAAPRDVRAWARYDVVDVLSPRAWWPLGAPRDEVEEVLAHELVHCAAYQRASERASWTSLGLPFWFREGMATTIPLARAPAMRGRLARYYEEHAGDAADDPVSRPERLERSDPALAYAAAHVAFALLADRHGDESAGRILDRMRAGATFREAFLAVTGTPVERFEAQARSVAARRP